MSGPSPQEAHDRVKKIVDRIQGLPSLPSTLTSINQMVLNTKTSPKEVAQLISSDPALTSKVLRIVNSTFYGFPNRIATITHAIVILGFNTIKSIVLSSSIFDVFQRNSDAVDFDRTEFWRHSVGCGAAARALGHRLNYPAAEELFIAGLLHDIGKIVLDQFLAAQFQEALRMAKERPCLLVQAEAEVFGFTHADVGSLLFEKWNLSKGLVQTTRFHHNPGLAGDSLKLAAIVHVADILVRALRFGNGGDEKIPIVSDSAWAALALEESEFDALLRQTRAEIEKATVFLDFAKK